MTAIPRSPLLLKLRGDEATAGIHGNARLPKEQRYQVLLENTAGDQQQRTTRSLRYCKSLSVLSTWGRGRNLPLSDSRRPRSGFDRAFYYLSSLPAFSTRHYKASQPPLL